MYQTNSKLRNQVDGRSGAVLALDGILERFGQTLPTAQYVAHEKSPIGLAGTRSDRTESRKWLSCGASSVLLFLLIMFSTLQPGSSLSFLPKCRRCTPLVNGSRILGPRGSDPQNVCFDPKPPKAALLRGRVELTCFQGSCGVNTANPPPETCWQQNSTTIPPGPVDCEGTYGLLEAVTEIVLSVDRDVTAVHDGGCSRGTLGLVCSKGTSIWLDGITASQNSFCEEAIALAAEERESVPDPPAGGADHWWYLSRSSNVVLLNALIGITEFSILGTAWISWKFFASYSAARGRTFAASVSDPLNFRGVGVAPLLVFGLGLGLTALFEGGTIKVTVQGNYAAWVVTRSSGPVLLPGLSPLSEFYQRIRRNSTRFLMNSLADFDFVASSEPGGAAYRYEGAVAQQCERYILTGGAFSAGIYNLDGELQNCDSLTVHEAGSVDGFFTGEGLVYANATCERTTSFMVAGGFIPRICVYHSSGKYTMWRETTYGRRTYVVVSSPVYRFRIRNDGDRPRFEKCRDWSTVGASSLSRCEGESGNWSALREPRYGSATEIFQTTIEGVFEGESYGLVIAPSSTVLRDEVGYAIHTWVFLVTWAVISVYCAVVILWRSQQFVPYWPELSYEWYVMGRRDGDLDNRSCSIRPVAPSGGVGFSESQGGVQHFGITTAPVRRDDSKPLEGRISEPSQV